MATAYAERSVVGRRLAIGNAHNLKSYGVAVTQPCVDCSISVGAENANVRAITIQLKDATGADIDYVELVEILVFGSAAMTSGATGGSTGLAIGTDGAIIATSEAKKHFFVTSEADGDIDLTWTDTGTESVAIGVRLPNGRVVVSEAFANT